MLIVCPSCATSYDVDAASLSPSGRQVRCARCRTVWRAELDRADELVAAAVALAPNADAAHPTDPAPVAPLPAAMANAAGGSGRTFGRRAGEGVVAAAATAPEPESEVTVAEEYEPEPADVDVAAEAAGESVEAPSITPEDGGDGGAGGADGEPLAATEDDHPPPPPTELAEDVESVAARRYPSMGARGSLRWPLSPLATGILLLALLDAILVGWRNDVVRALPQTASFFAALGLPVNLRGLTFDEVATATEQHEGVPILVVEGYVVNGAHRLEDVPRLKFILRNAARQEIYSWTAVPARGSLPPGEAVAFRTRLASPPADAHDLVLRFVTRRDVYAGMH
jgi:predicted Zn finger-like uncharacterized protein